MKNDKGIAAVTTHVSIIPYLSCGMWWAPVEREDQLLHPDPGAGIHDMTWYARQITVPVEYIVCPAKAPDNEQMAHVETFGYSGTCPSAGHS